MKLIVLLFATTLWLKGNLHTHTNESDGDSAPAEIVQWYASHGYDFLSITDHDKVTKASSDAIVLIPGEEITDKLSKQPLHVNAIGIETAIAPQKGATASEVLQRNVDAVRKAGGVSLINHPNFGWAFGAKELMQLEGATMLEIASGHPYVNSDGPPSVEAMWDELLTSGKRIYAAAVDDVHHLKRPWDTDIAPPGKAWVVVRAEKNAASILDALRRGDFYASTGVELEEYAATGKRIDVRVKEKNGARYRIRFVGRGGGILQETAGPAATYTIKGNEGYVRAKVIDSNGRAAWMQPVWTKE